MIQRQDFVSDFLSLVHLALVDCEGEGLDMMGVDWHDVVGTFWPS